MFAIFAILIVNLRRSTTGLALNAVRWSENASRTMGLSVITMKMLVSGLAAFVAGVGGGLYALSFKQAIPLDYATLLGLVWLAVLVTFGVRSNIAALLAGLLFTFSPAFIQTVLKLDAPVVVDSRSSCSVSVPSRWRRTRRAPCTSGPWACQRMLHKASGGGARAVPAATAFAGRHDPRLHHDDDPPTAARTVATRRHDRGGGGLMSTAEATPTAGSRRRGHARASRPATSPCASAVSSPSTT